MDDAQGRLLFEGLRVLDVGSFVAAPTAATILGDLGADVIKIEPPGEGDPQRRLGRAPMIPQHAVNYCWELTSRNKRSLALDLKTDAGARVLQTLVRKADVFVTNYTAKVRENLKLRYEDISPLNARLIYASMTGFGESGPDVNQPGYDATSYFARSGQFDALTPQGGAPPFALPGQGDQMAAVTLYAAIVSGLYNRALTNRGGWVGTSLLANGLWSNAILAQGALLGAFIKPRPPRSRPLSALSNSYKTADGRWFQMTLVQEDKLWAPLCRALERPDLPLDPRFVTTPDRRANSEALVEILDQAFSSLPWAHWKEVLRTHMITFGSISRMEDVVADEQIRAVDLFCPTDNPALPLTVENPIALGMSARRRATPAPAVGEHTDAILSEAGLGGAEIAHLRATGIVA